jgi:hypothetical protein
MPMMAMKAPRNKKMDIRHVIISPNGWHYSSLLHSYIYVRDNFRLPHEAIIRRLRQDYRNGGIDLDALFSEEDFELCR